MRADSRCARLSFPKALITGSPLPSKKCRMANSGFALWMAIEIGRDIRTIAGHGGGWQNSHHHDLPSKLTSWNAVGLQLQRWRMASWKIRICEPGGVFTIPPGIAHNLYLCREFTHTPSNTAALARGQIGYPTKCWMK